ncbi:unnamed protein product [Ilex paraguariensis]|uniref:F-box domain-containing protein n=1 Tax=Ilex paraguariensis TaxID=185542 RepID=A0ABC8U5C1_9AQUA
MGGPLTRYRMLGLRESLSESDQYSIACKQLCFILRIAYSKVEKILRSLIFQDILTAFRLLPQMQTQAAVSAAKLLLQNAEAALPIQMKVLAVMEFKHAMVACKRRCEARQEEECLVQLPPDVLLHIFSLVDWRSLASAAVVCRSWNTASSDNSLWHLQYVACFGNLDPRSGERVEKEEFKRLEEDVAAGVCTDWKDAFKRAYTGLLFKRFTFRGYCSCCDAIVWLSNMTFYYSFEPCAPYCQEHEIKPLINSADC